MEVLLQRQCGGCTICCQVYQVRELEKPEGVLCCHAVAGSGCQIYADRPLGCWLYQCEWLRGWGEEADRPDRLRAILFRSQAAWNYVAELQIFGADPEAIYDLDSPAAKELILETLSKGEAIAFLHARGKKELLVRIDRASALSAVSRFHGFTIIHDFPKR